MSIDNSQLEIRAEGALETLLMYCPECKAWVAVPAVRDWSGLRPVETYFVNNDPLQEEQGDTCPVCGTVLAFSEVVDAQARSEASA